MKGQTHLTSAIAATLGAAAMLHTPTPESLASVAALLVGSLLPDIDGDGEIVRPGNWLPNIAPHGLRRGLNSIGLSFSRAIKATIGHRGATHWPLWAILAMIASYHWAIPWLWWLGVGLLIHIAGDFITVQGAPLLGPASRRKFSLKLMRTGQTLEWWLGWLLWGVIAVSVAVLGMRWVM